MIKLNIFFTNSFYFWDSLRAGRSGDRIPVGARFSALLQNGPGTHLTSCQWVPGLLPEVKLAGAWRWPPPHLRQGQIKSPLHPWVLMVCYMVNFILLYASLLEERQRNRRQKLKLNILQSVVIAEDNLSLWSSWYITMLRSAIQLLHFPTNNYLKILSALINSRITWRLYSMRFCLNYPSYALYNHGSYEGLSAGIVTVRRNSYFFLPSIVQQGLIY